MDKKEIKEIISSYYYSLKEELYKIVYKIEDKINDIYTNIKANTQDIKSISKTVSDYRKLYDKQITEIERKISKIPIDDEIVEPILKIIESIKKRQDKLQYTIDNFKIEDKYDDREIVDRILQVDTKYDTMGKEYGKNIDSLNKKIASIRPTGNLRELIDFDTPSINGSGTVVVYDRSKRIFTLATISVSGSTPRKKILTASNVPTPTNTVTLDYIPVNIDSVNVEIFQDGTSGTSVSPFTYSLSGNILTFTNTIILGSNDVLVISYAS